MNKIESEVIEIAIASIIANRTKSSHGEPRQDIFGADPEVKDFESDPVVQAASHVIKREIHEAYLAGVSYTAWYHNHGSEAKPPNLKEYMDQFENGLIPTEPEIPVSPMLSSEEIHVPKWLTDHNKAVIGSNGITYPPNETQKV